jgi:hypothetical protein
MRSGRNPHYNEDLRYRSQFIREGLRQINSDVSMARFLIKNFDDLLKLMPYQKNKLSLRISSIRILLIEAKDIVSNSPIKIA